jgi:hypothetical protein
MFGKKNLNNSTKVLLKKLALLLKPQFVKLSLTENCSNLNVY